jgi:hypothetical protein
MPDHWLVVPFGAEGNTKIARKCRVRGIPTLAVFDADGSVITTDARIELAMDAEGARFPWRPRSAIEMLREAGGDGDGAAGAEGGVRGADGAVELDLPGGAGRVKLADVLARATDGIALYFSASWCGPCRQFSPLLAEWYKARKAGPRGDKFEVILVNSDRDAESAAA